MKILWVSPFFLHPTDRGGQIRTLGTLKELHKKHHIHFAALNDPQNTEGPRRSSEYASAFTAVDHLAPKRNSIGILPQLLGTLMSRVPLAVSRYASAGLRRQIGDLLETGQFDSVVCDFLASAPNVPELSKAVLFQHNVETTIWQRHAERESMQPKKWFFGLQARRMEAYEREVCRRSKQVIAVSTIDAERMRRMFGVEHVEAVPTGVDLEYFRPAGKIATTADLVFCGSMDWLPNVDAMEHFLGVILPLIRAQRPATTVTIAGRSPDSRVHQAAAGLPGVTITGNVADMRPYLWGAKVSIVPIRIGGGTRLKIYECMAAGLPVVSTTVGAEGLAYADGRDILIADSPEEFAGACLRLLVDEDARRKIAASALSLVEENCSWRSVAAQFGSILEAHRISLHDDGDASTRGGTELL